MVHVGWSGDAVAERFTVPEKVPVGVTVIVDVPAVFAVVVIDAGLAESVKAPLTDTGTLTVLDNAPLVPVTTTVNPAAGSGLQLTDRVLPERVAVQPVGCVLVTASVTVPENPLMFVTEIVDVPAVPAVVSEIVAGVEARVKSWIVTSMPTVRVIEPLTPWTVTVNGVTPVEQVTLTSPAVLMDCVQPPGAAEVIENATVPAKPFIAFTATCEVPATVARVVRAGAERVKSCTVTRIPTVRVMEPLKP
jgi:hypothetical protein